MPVSLEDPDLDENQRQIDAELDRQPSVAPPVEEQLNYSAPPMPPENLDYGDHDWGGGEQQQSALAVGPPAYSQPQQPQQPSLGPGGPYAPPQTGRGAPTGYAQIPDPLPVRAVTGGRSREPVKFDKPIEGAEPFFAAGAEPVTKKPSWWDDFSNQVIVGAQGMGADGLAAAHYAATQLTDNPRVAQYVEQQRAALEQNIKARVEAMSPEARQAWSSSLFDKDAPMPADPVAYLSSTVASAVPSIVMALVPGGVVGRALALTARGVGLGAKAAAVTELGAKAAQAASTAGRIGTAGRLATTAGAFGTTQAGQMYGALSTEVGEASDETLMTNPAYAKDRNAGASIEEAKANIMRKIGPAMAAQFALGAATGVALGEVLPGGGPKLLRPATRMGAIATGAGEGAVTMGTQAGGGNLITQTQQVQAGLRPQIDPEEAARKAAGGVVGGAALGGAAGTVRGLRRPAEVPPPGDPTISGETYGQEGGPPPGPGRPTGTPNVSPENEAALGQALNTGQLALPPPGGAASASASAPRSALPTEGPIPTNRSLVARPAPDPTTGAPTSRAPPMPDSRGVDAAVSALQISPSQGMGRREMVQQLAGEMSARDLRSMSDADLAAAVDQRARAAAMPQVEQQHGVYAARAAQHILNRTPVNDVYAQHGPDVAALVNQRYQSEAAQRRAVQPQPRVHPPEPPPPAPLQLPASRERGEGFTVGQPPAEPRVPLQPDTSRVAPASVRGEPPLPPVEPAPRQLPAPPRVAERAAGESFTMGEPQAQPRQPLTPTTERVAPTSLVQTPTAPAAPRQIAGPHVRGEGFTVDQPQPPYPQKVPLEPSAERAAPSSRTQINRGPPDGREGGVAPEPTPAPTKGGGGEGGPKTKGEAAPPATAALMTEEGRAKPLNKGEQLKAEQAAKVAANKAKAEVEPAPTKKEVTKRKPAPQLTAKQIREKAAAAQAERIAKQKAEREKAAQDERAGRISEEAETEGPAGQKQGVTVESARGDESSTTHMVEPVETREAPTPADTTTSSLDRGRMIEERLVAGDIDIMQADREFGAEPTGPGKPRAAGMKNIRDYLETRINQLQDRLVELDDEAIAASTETEQAAIARETTRTQSRLADLARHATEYDSQRAASTGAEARARFRATTGLDTNAPRKPTILGSEDPSGSGAGGPEAGGLEAGGGLAGRDAHLKMHYPGMANVVKERLSTQRPVHDYINAIINSAHIKSVLPEVVTMARKLAGMVPRGIKVMSFEDAAAHSPILANHIAEAENANKGLQGFYYRVGNERIIAINSSGTHQLHSIMHEMFHSITSELLERQGGSKPIGTAPLTGPIQVLNAIAKELAIADFSHLSLAEQSRLAYALNNYHELHTMLMSSPTVRGIAADITPSVEFKQALARQGYKLGERENVWSAFVGWVRRITGMERASASLLDHIIRPIEDITEAAYKHNELMNAVSSMRGAPKAMAARRYEEIMPQDPELRGVASQVFDALDASERGEGRIYDSADNSIPGYDAAVRRTNQLFGTQSRPEGTEGRAGRLRPAALQMFPDVAIVDRYRDVFRTPEQRTADGREVGGKDLLEQWYQTSAAQRKAEKDFLDTHDAAMRDIIGKFNEVGDRGGEGVSSLWRDATMEDIRLDPAGRHTNTVDEANAARVNELYAKYDGLSAKEKDAYNSGRKQYDILYEAKRNAELENVATMAFPEATRPQLDALKTALKTRRGTEQLLNGTEPSQLRDQLGESVLRDRELVRRVAEIASYGHHNGYGPLSRHGDFVVTWGDRGTPSYGVRMFERYNDAETFRRGLMAKNETDVSQVSSKAKQHLSDIARPSAAIDRIVDKVDRVHGTERAEEMRQLLSGMMLDAMGRGAKSRMRRQGIKGADPITAQVIARDFASLASKMGFVAGGADRSLALNAMRRHVEAVERTPNGRLPGEAANAPFRDAVAMRHVLHEVEARVPRTDDNSPAMLGVTRQATRFAYAHQLLSLSHVAVNTVESSLLGASHMFGRHNPVRVALAMSRATASILPRALLKGGRLAITGIGRALQRADWDVNKVLRDHALAAGYDRAAVDSLYQTLEREGMGGHTMSAELRRLAKEGFVPRDSSAGRGINRVGAGVDRAMDIITITQHFAEAANRWAVALAAHQLERGKGASVDAATAYALQMLRRSVPDFGGKARIATAQGIFGKWGSPLMQFRNYGLFYTSMMAGVVHRALRASDPVTRREAQRALAGIIATQAAAVGVLSWTADPTRYLLGAYDLITGKQHPHNYQNDIQRWLASYMGPTMGELVAKGGIRYTTGMALNDRMGSKNVLNIPEVNAFNDPKAWAGALVSFAGGASGETQTEYLAAANKLFAGDFLGASKGLLPRIVADPVKAWDRAAHGIRDTRGKVGLPASKIPVWATVMQAGGIRPTPVANYFEGRSAVTEYQQEQKELHDKTLRVYTDAQQSRSGQQAFREALARYNKAYPAQPITTETLQGIDKRQAERTRDPRTFGLYLPKKAIPAATAAASFIPRS